MTLENKYPGETDEDRAEAAEVERLASEFLAIPPQFTNMPIEYGTIRRNALGLIVARVAGDKMNIGDIVYSIITFAIIECEDADEARSADEPHQDDAQ